MLIFFTFLYLLSNIAIGLWASTKVKNSADFAVAGRNLRLSVAATSIFATWFGSETVMSSSVNFAQGGFLAVIKEPFGAVLCLFLIGLFFVRPLYRLNIITFSDYFRMRFGLRAEGISAALMSFSYLSWIAAQLQATGIILASITQGSDFALSVEMGVGLGAGIVAIYTCIGGMWAVSLTDFVQTIVIVAGLSIVLLLLLWDLPEGFGGLVAEQPQGFFKFFPYGETIKPVSYEDYTVAWFTVGLGSIAQQDVFQRTLSAKTERIAVNSAYLAAFLYLVLAMLPLFIGLMGRKLYPQFIDGLSEAEAQMLLPKLVLAHTPIWVQIMFFGALISAIMSTTSGAILSPATLIAENLIKPRFPQLTDRQVLALLRASVVFVSLWSVYMALSGKTIYELAEASSSSILVTLFIPLAAGVYWSKASTAGALWAMFLGAGVFGLQDWLLPNFGFPAMLSGLFMSCLGMVLGSWLWPRAKLA